MAQTNWIPGLLSAWWEEPGEELLVAKMVTFGGSQGFHQDQNSDRAYQPVPVVLVGFLPAGLPFRSRSYRLPPPTVSGRRLRTISGMLSGGLDICCEHQKAIFTTVFSSTWLLDNTGVEADPQFRRAWRFCLPARTQPL